MAGATIGAPSDVSSGRALAGPFLAALTEDDARELRALGRVRTYSAGDAIYHQGDDAGSVSVLLEGRVKIATVTAAGKEVILAFRGGFHGRTAQTMALTSSRVTIRATVRAFDRTGVEMEALTAVAIAALTVYDMCKAVDRGMRIVEVRLDEKAGGKSGTWRRKRGGPR